MTHASTPGPKVGTVDLGKDLEDSVEWLSEDGGFWTTEGKVRGAGVFGLANVDPAADDLGERLEEEKKLICQEMVLETMSHRQEMYMLALVCQEKKGPCVLEMRVEEHENHP